MGNPNRSVMGQSWLQRRPPASRSSTAAGTYCAPVPHCRDSAQRVQKQDSEARGQRLIEDMVMEAMGAGLGCEGWESRSGVNRKVESSWTRIGLLSQCFKGPEAIYLFWQNTSNHKLQLLNACHIPGRVHKFRLNKVLNKAIKQ